VLKGGADHSRSGILQGVDAQILALFRQQQTGFVSGEELSRDLGISRTAVWKHIKALRELGYQIEAIPSQGYRLVATPDLLTAAELAAGLATIRIGRRFVCFRETASTNQVAFKLAEEGAEEGTVVVAEAQHSGKGRLGRHWQSPAGVNLYCSIIIRPPILPFNAPQLTFLTAVAVARAIEQSTTLKPRIKWPNDVLVNGRKVAGLLNEMSAETEGVNFVVLGIGVNINMRREQFPADLRHPATSFFLEGGKEVGRAMFVRALLTALDGLYDLYLNGGYAAIREEWLVRCNVTGKKVSVSFHDRTMTGVVMGVDDIGALLLELPDGRIERVLAGDVTIL